MYWNISQSDVINAHWLGQPQMVWWGLYLVPRQYGSRALDHSVEVELGNESTGRY